MKLKGGFDVGICRRIYNLIRIKVNELTETGKKKVRESDILQESDKPTDLGSFEEEWRKFQEEMAKRRPLSAELRRCYRILGVPTDADLKTVENKFKSLLKKNHPDLFPDPKKKKEADEYVGNISAAFHKIKAYLEPIK